MTWIAMQSIDPFTGAVVALCAALLMVQAGVGKRRLSWRTEPVSRPRRRSHRRRSELRP